VIGRGRIVGAGLPLLLFVQSAEMFQELVCGCLVRANSLKIVSLQDEPCRFVYNVV